MKILSRIEQPWPCRREEAEQPHHQIHLLIADPCTDDEADNVASLYAEILTQNVYVHYWQSEATWTQTYAMVEPGEGDGDGLPAQP